MRIVLSVLLVCVLAAAAIGGVMWEGWFFQQPGPAPARTVVVINPGSGLSAISLRLWRAGVVRSGFAFQAAAILRRKTAQLKAGEYAFPPHASEANVMAMLVAHKVVEHRITIAEGLTSGMAVSLIDADPALTGTSPEVSEGTLLPETYLFELGTTRAQLLERMHKAQADIVEKLWAARKEGLPFRSVDDALKLASIVATETAIPSERPHVAAVYINRLRSGMKLEADPTIIYGLTKGVALGHGITQGELQTPNPYSTYQIDGLPPTPICNPGRGSIAAVLMPDISSDLYFVADGTGGHVFARTKAEHEQNVARWRVLQQQMKSAHTEVKFFH